MFACQECGKKFRTVSAAERASNDGCPKCGGVDVDLDMSARPKPPKTVKSQARRYFEEGHEIDGQIIEDTGWHVCTFGTWWLDLTSQEATTNAR